MVRTDDVEPSGKRRAVGAVVAATSMALLAYAAYRAGTLSFTHDESLSFFAVSGSRGLLISANNHPLNSLLMTACHALLGPSELALRLPNVAALVLYLLACARIAVRATSGILAVCGFLLLTTNPFVLDFFSLARGYGLSLAFLMAALALWSSARESGSLPGAALSIAVLGAVGVAANLSILVFHGLLQAFVLGELVLVARRRGKGWRAGIRACLPTVLLNAVLLLGVLAWLLLLRNRGELYYGGVHGLIEDTVLSLSEVTLYTEGWSAAAAPALAALAVAVFAILVATVVRARITGGSWTTGGLLTLILGATLGVHVLLNRLTKTPYPIERTALHVIPVFFLAAYLVVRERAPGSGPGRFLPSAAVIVAGAVATIHLLRATDPHAVRTWAYDAGTKNALAELRRAAGPGPLKPESISLGIDWVFEPTLNYYRVTHGLSWLRPVTRARPQSQRYDFYYLFLTRQRAAGPADGRQLIRSFPGPGTVLVRSR